MNEVNLVMNTINLAGKITLRVVFHPPPRSLISNCLKEQIFKLKEKGYLPSIAIRAMRLKFSGLTTDQRYLIGNTA